MAIFDGNSTFRANPEYTVVSLDRLNISDQQRLQEINYQGDLYGVLAPLSNVSLDFIAVSCDTALLFMTLTKAGHFPYHAMRSLGQQSIDNEIIRLVVDGVLQVLHNDNFICGPCAIELISPQNFDEKSAKNSDLSISALKYGQELTFLSEAELGQRIYCYGRQPISPELARILCSADEIAPFAGINEDSPLIRLLGKALYRVPSSPSMHEYWVQWVSRAESSAHTEINRADYKLYISPDLHEECAALEVIAGTLASARGITGFKIGVGIAGMCRPDKILAYFTHLDDLHKFAEVLQTQLIGCKAHGVPFTAAISTDGLLSWGADPPRVTAISGILQATSWRIWVTRCLAEYLIVARKAELNSLEPWQFALERLSLSGIDIDTWIPGNGMWPVALETA